MNNFLFDATIKIFLTDFAALFQPKKSHISHILDFLATCFKIYFDLISILTCTVFHIVFIIR